MSSSNARKNHHPITAATLAIAVVAAALAVGSTGLLPARAQAAPVPEDRVLLGVVESTAVLLGPQVPLAEKFDEPTATLVPLVALVEPATKNVASVASPKPAKQSVKMHRAFEHRASRKGHGTWRRARVSWYGPGLYGNGMAGGGKLKRNSMVVAHRSLPFGTRILFRYKGRSVIAVVRDRGPFISGRKFDLGPGTARALHFDGVGTVKYRIIRRK